jgi:hypothetical protein
LPVQLRIELKTTEHTSFPDAGTRTTLEEEVATALYTISTKQALTITLNTPSHKPFSYGKPVKHSQP